MARSWYEVKNVSKSAADLYLYDEIGLFGVSAGQFVNEIKGLKGKTLNVYVNSPGGNVFDGIAIYNSLKRHDGKVNMTVDGIAASAASFIVQAGSTRKMAQASEMMIHDAWGIAMGPTDEMVKMASELELHSNSVAGIYASRAGGTVEEWRARMKEESWYGAQGAIDAGLADDHTETSGIKALAGRVFNLSKFQNVPENVQKANASNAFTGLLGDTWADPVLTTVNSTNAQIAIINEPAHPGEEPVQTRPEAERKVEMAEETAIRQALGLGDEGDVIAAINALKSAATDIATGEKGAENALRKENATLRQQLLTQESDYGQRILALEDRNRQKEAAYAVDSAIAQGRVAPKDRELALKLALNDADGFEQFAKNLRVDLDERGRAMDATMAAIEPTEAEIALGRQMGLTREQIMAQKAKDAGIQVPS